MNRLLPSIVACTFVAACAASSPAPDPGSVGGDAADVFPADPGIGDASTDAGALPVPSRAEADLRAALGIPAGAKRVVVFGQTSHLDLDWQKTFDDYYASYIEGIFLSARQILDAQPRAFYGIAEMAILARHLERHPGELAPLKAAVARGALRLVGGGWTSPDTLLPETELLLHDWLFGIRFAEDTMGGRPRSAWLPDSFGHSGTAPDVLAAAGYDSVAFARVDGAPSVVMTILDPGVKPLPGSTAEKLQQLGSADFLWRGPGGGTVLAHWMSSNLYCQGDTLDYDEPIQVPGGHIGTFDDSHAFTDGRVDQYVAALAPYARTPYLFVPVGCDFQYPKDRLVEFLDGYDARQYPSSGVWAVAATFEDFAQLVLSHRDELPVLDGELSPYFMGFYSSRAALKRRVREAARPFLAAETFGAALGKDGAAILADVRPAFEKLAASNHHDYLPGTSTDAVVSQEQLPWLDDAEKTGQEAWQKVAKALADRIAPESGALSRVVVFNPAGVRQDVVVRAEFPIPAGMTPKDLHAVRGTTAVPLAVIGSGEAPGSLAVKLGLDTLPAWSWTAIDLLPGAAGVPTGPVVDLRDADGKPATGPSVTQVVLSNAHVEARFEREAGGSFALVSLTFGGVEALSGPSFRISDYEDDGGLWRLGHEMDGCSFTPMASPGGLETVTVLEQAGLTVAVAFEAEGRTREARLDSTDRGLRLALTTGASEGTTRTARFSFQVPAKAPLRTSSPAGFLDRQPRHLYDPTFWPAVAWASIGPWAVLLRQSTGVRFGEDGTVELQAVRDARMEQCDLLGGNGADTASHRLEWMLVQAGGPVQAEEAAMAWNRPAIPFAVKAPGKLPELPGESSLAGLGGDGVLSALKPADRGEGVILRALLMPGPVTVHLSPLLAGRHAYRVDVAERDLEDLGMVTDTLVLDRGRFGSIASVRLR